MTVPDESGWSPTSWQRRTATQQATYEDAEGLRLVVEEISRLPPLVTSWEIEALREKLALAAVGQAFVLQGGDCAESFAGCRPDPIAATLKILLQMSLVLVHATRKPVVRVGRIAGQYAKPRSSDQETRDGVTLPSYRGDIINALEFSARSRVADPQLLLRGYERAALTLNFIRALTDEGFADLHHPEYWDLRFVDKSEHAQEYRQLVRSIRESIEFMEAISGIEFASTRRVEFYSSHEGLSLWYEQAQTRRVPHRPGFYNLSTHFPWLGMRTANVDDAHVEYFRGIRNPIAVKVGPAMTPEWLVRLIEVLDPEGEPGRLTLIHRMGASHIAGALPPLIRAASETGRPVLWIADPMHGNTESTASGIKTRRFDRILDELQQAFEVHAAEGSRLAGVHFELTGDDVTECIGGARNLTEEDLERAYLSPVDPRLNYDQALEMAMLIARQLGHQDAG